MNNRYVAEWMRMFQAVRREYGIYGTADPGGAQWFWPDGSKAFRTCEMWGSAEQDFMAMTRAILSRTPE